MNTALHIITGGDIAAVQPQLVEWLTTTPSPRRPAGDFASAGDKLRFTEQPLVRPRPRDYAVFAFILAVLGCCVCFLFYRLFFFPSISLLACDDVGYLVHTASFRPSFLEYFYLFGAVSAAIGACVYYGFGVHTNSLGAIRYLYSIPGRMRLETASELLAQDNRAPILFLRPFTIDNDEIKGGAIVEQSISPLLSAAGPVIAIQDPKHMVPIVGAARFRVSDEEWRSAVTQYVELAQLVVIVLNDSDGVSWELDLVFSNGAWRKTIFLLPPIRRGFFSVLKTNQGAVDLLTRALKTQDTAASVELGKVWQHRSLVAFFVDKCGQAYGVSGDPTERTYQLACRAGIYALRHGALHELERGDLKQRSADDDR